MRLFELILVTLLFFLLTFYLLYTFVFESLCGGYSKSDKNSDQITVAMANCKDIPVCKLDNIEYTKNEVSNWSCKRTRVERFHLPYYKEYINSKI